MAASFARSRPIIARKFGRIINMASPLDHKGAPEITHYAACCRQGVRHRLHPLARLRGGAQRRYDERHLLRYDRERKLNELSIGRAGQVDEIAPTAVLLASEEGAYYVGATTTLNGGDVMI